MTKAVVLYSAGGPEVLVMEDRPVGEPGAGQIKMRHTAIGLNYAETQIRRGVRKGLPITYPYVMGGEAAGVVTAVGEGVTGMKKGDRVCYFGNMGSYAEERLIAAEHALPIPDDISDDIAAATLLKGLTAHYLIFRTFPVKKGHTILYHAAAGGVGLILCQWAKHLGATVIGTVSSDAKIALAKAHGCDHVINYAKEDFVARVKELTGGRGVDCCYDSVAKDTFEKSLQTLAPFGLVSLFGSASGDVDPMSYSKIPLDRYYIHPTLPQYMGKREERLAGLKDLYDAIRKGVIKVEINQRYALKDAAQAHADMEGRKTTGSTIITP